MTRWGHSKRMTGVLWILLIVGSASYLFLHRSDVGGDAEMYIGLADGLLQGRYSYWYFFPEYVPDTLRTPGYPFWLVPFRLLSCHVWVIQLAQLGLYWLAVYLILDVLARVTPSRRARNFALAGFLAGVHLMAFVPLIFPEMLLLFLFALYLRLFRWRTSFGHSLGIGVLEAAIYLVRPTFLLFPILRFMCSLRQRRNWRSATVATVTFLALLIPFGLWNLVHHHTFRVTPLEGGGGVFHLGYWHYKLPAQRTDQHLWHPVFSRELVTFTPPDQARENLQRFLGEVAEIEGACAGLLQPSDLERLARMSTFSSLFQTFPAAYVMCRENRLLAAFLKHVLADPVFYLLTRVYQLPRLMVTGLDLDRLEKAQSTQERLQACAPFAISIFFFAVWAVSAIWASLSARWIYARFAPGTLLLFYWWLVHLLPAVQARYTIPIRPFLIVLAAAALDEMISRRKQSPKLGSAEATRR